MNEANESAPIQPIAVIRDGLLDRLKTQAGIKSDDSFARLIGVSRATLARYKAGDEVSMRAAVGVAVAFGLGLGEVVEMRKPSIEADAVREAVPA